MPLRNRGIVAWGLVVLVVSLPVGFVLAILLFPFWSWIERTYGIEAVGHSGPADWCFWASYGFVVLVATLTALPRD